MSLIPALAAAQSLPSKGLELSWPKPVASEIVDNYSHATADASTYETEPPPPKYCGQEIGAAFGNTMDQVRDDILAFAAVHPDEFVAECSGLNLPGMAGNWDLQIPPGHPTDARCAAPESGCQDCVSIHGARNNRWDANYALWGLAARMCGWSEEFGGAIMAEYKDVKGLLTSDDGLTQEVVDWYRIGYSWGGRLDLSFGVALSMLAATNMMPFDRTMSEQCPACPTCYRSNTTYPYHLWITQ